MLYYPVNNEGPHGKYEGTVDRNWTFRCIRHLLQPRSGWITESYIAKAFRPVHKNNHDYYRPNKTLYFSFLYVIDRKCPFSSVFCTGERVFLQKNKSLSFQDKFTTIPDKDQILSIYYQNPNL